MSPSRFRLPLVALPLLVSGILAFFMKLLPVPIDVGYPAGTPWYLELYGSCYAWLHAPAILLLDRINGHLALVWFLTGWLTTFCCLLALAVCFDFLRNRRHGAVLTAEGPQA